MKIVRKEEIYVLSFRTIMWMLVLLFLPVISYSQTYEVYRHTPEEEVKKYSFNEDIHLDEFGRLESPHFQSLLVQENGWPGPSLITYPSTITIDDFSHELMMLHHLVEARKYAMSIMGDEYPFEEVSIEFQSDYSALVPTISASYDSSSPRIQVSIASNVAFHYNPLATDAYAIIRTYFMQIHRAFIENSGLSSGDGIQLALGTYFAHRYMTTEDVDLSVNNIEGDKVHVYGGHATSIPSSLNAYISLESNLDNIVYNYNEDDFGDVIYRAHKISEVLFASLIRLGEILDPVGITGDEAVEQLIINSFSLIDKSVKYQPDVAAIIFNKATELNYSPTDLCQVYTLFKSVYGAAFTQNIIYQENLFADCSKINSITYHTYYDVNQNGQKDTEDFFLSDIKLNLGLNTQYISQQYNQQILTNTEGELVVSVDPEANTDWSLTSGTSSYTVTIDSTYVPDTLLFGFYPTVPRSEVNVYINSEPTRCNTEVDYYYTIKNEGNTVVTNGGLWTTLSTSTSSYTGVINLNPGETFVKTKDLSVPGPGSTYFDFGIDLKSSAKFEYKIDNEEFTTEADYTSVILCSYDPNDKLVSPNRESNRIYPEEVLTYTVRFQNTGNAEAIHVSVKDTLDGALDYSTFQVISSSHNEVLNTSISEERNIDFNFVNINLPDSTSNQAESQGYVTYTILPRSDLSTCTTIQNTASIYFDANPPIVTNTTESIYYISCDDGNVCTIDDVLGKDGLCRGTFPDTDQDGYYECDSCGLAEVFVDSLGLDVGDEDDEEYFQTLIGCDQCVGLDDDNDYNDDGVLDCVDPPWYPVCPDDFRIVPNFGMVLRFSAEDINDNELPIPIAFQAVTKNTNNVFFINNLFHDKIDSIFDNGVNYKDIFYEFDPFDYVTGDFGNIQIVYSEHQSCSFTEIELVTLPCPNEINFENEFMKFYSLNKDIDMEEVLGKYIFDDGINNFNLDASIYTPYYEGAVLILNPVGSGMNDTFEGLFNGILTLPSGQLCNYENGIQEDCTSADVEGNTLTVNPGLPCDDNNPCTHHDKYLTQADGICNCIGIPKPDRDDDGTCDAADNCYLTYNPDQLDTDNDGHGDICDTDDDNDGVPDTEDNCPLIANPNQDDEDEDGVGDLCEGLSVSEILGDVTINPNPVTDILFVSNSDKNQYSIINAVGQLVDAGSVDSGQINVQGLNSGIYFLMISTEEEVRSFKFVKN